jgi:hypothetical protein
MNPRCTPVGWNLLITQVHERARLITVANELSHFGAKSGAFITLRDHGRDIA